jgi:glycosyltransferase involved in cell wall biosynthesis
MATVSILIPAFKPDYLEKAIISALTQTFKDTEILVGDDTLDGRLREIVARFDDPRVKYIHHGMADGRINSRLLWERASGHYVKWLYDDDVLMPGSVEALVSGLRQHPGATMAFHERVTIDGDDKVINVPASLIAAGEMALLDRKFLVQKMIATASNFIGEPSNIMMVRDSADFASVMAYRSWPMTYLTDVAMFINLAEKGPVVVVGGYLSCFRKHASQCSSTTSPIAAAGYYEWEILIRGEAAAGKLSAQELVAAKERMKGLYALGIAGLGLSALEELRRNIDELIALPTAELFDSPRFLAAVAHVQTAMTRAREAAASPA